MKDHVKAILEVLNNGNLGETYNIGGNNEKTNIEVVNTICNILDQSNIQKPNNLSSFLGLIEFVEDRPGHDIRYAIDNTKIKEEIGWAPVSEFNTSLKSTVQWYLDNSSWLKKINKRSLGPYES